jgi:hypothetical protein
MSSRKVYLTNGEGTPFVARRITEVEGTCVSNVTSGTRNTDMTEDTNLHSSCPSFTIHKPVYLHLQPVL